MKRKQYDPAVQAYMRRAAKNLRKASRSKNPELMWAVLYNIKATIKSYEKAAHEMNMRQSG